MSQRYFQGVESSIIPASNAGGSNYSGVYTLDQLNRLNAVYPNHIANSLRFRSSASAYLNRTPASASSQTTWTWSAWVKRGTINASANMQLFSASGTTFSNAIQFTGGGTNDILRVQFDGNNAGVVPTAAVYRDPSSWYHIVVAVDTTQATASNRVRIYVNGAEVVYGTATYPSQNYATAFNSANAHNVGRDSVTGSNYFDGYMAEVNFIDGQALTPSSFGQFYYETGVWCPKAYSGTYGTNGFKLNFSNGTSTTTLGYDSSGNGNNWTTNNISLTAGSTYDWMIDSPTPFAGSSYGVGNYAVLNPLSKTVGSLLDGNLTASGGTGSFGTAYSTIYVSSGKWYWEGVFSVVDPNDGSGFGVASPDGQNCYIRNQTGSSYIQSSVTGVPSQNPFGVGYASGDVIGVAFNVDNLTLSFYKNGTLIGSVITGFPSGRTWSFFIFCRASFSTTTGSVNFGQRPFAYTPPTGFKSLCTFNLPTPTIQNGANHMAATTYTGNGSTQSISNIVNGVSFQPDFVWIKSRSAATDHALYDVIRGTQNRLESNTTDAAVASDNGLTAFGTSGFTVNTLAQVNTNAATYVGWQWKANGTAVTNTAGSITSQVSANTTAGFSVVTFTTPSTVGSWTVGHGLGIAPSFIVMKARSNSSGWPVYHSAVGNTSYLVLNTTAAQAANIDAWNNTSPTSTVFTNGSINFFGNTYTYVAYCFAAIPGYSAFGSYTGNGSTDGPFIYTGFRPRWIMVKRTDSTADWVVFDTSRDSYNMEVNYLVPNTSGAEASGASVQLDGLSNGFKIRGTWQGMNASGGTYVYACFAENPFKFSLAR